jgi:hypothetical protein
MRLSFKESRTKSTSAANLERKSGGAERRDLRFRGPLVEMFFDRAYPDFLPRSTWTGTHMRLSFKEGRMMFANATHFYRKSGVA